MARTQAVRRASARLSRSSTHSSITIQGSSSSDALIASTTDASSVSADLSTPKETDAGNRRVGRPRRSLVTSYNENVLSRGDQRRTSEINGTRNISGKTLVEGGPEETILDESTKALRMDWELNMENLGKAKSENAEEAGLKRRSTRVALVEKVKGGVRGTLSTLGKRARETVDSGKENVQSAAMELKRRASTRLTPAAVVSKANKEPDKEPVTKKARLSGELVEIKKNASPAPLAKAKSKGKRWLAKGLYVGQDRSFNPRLTVKNRIKAAAKKQPAARERKMLPLPMFLGERLLGMGRDFRLPYDVFNPLPPGQPKPEEWRKTQKSMYLRHLCS
jgi:histone-lysine N-methyltransferase ASH1L